MILKLDPRTKLYCLLLANALLFLHVSLEVEIIIVVLFLIPYYFSGRRKSALRFALYYAVLVCLDFISGGITNRVLASFIGLFSSGIRMMFPCLISGAYAFTTTTPQEFIAALRKMHVPETVIIPCVVVIRYFPSLKEDYTQIRYAMAMRGIATGTMAWITHPAQMLEYILIPLLMSSNTVASDLSVAALTKGIGISTPHTCMTEIKMRWSDYMVIVVYTLPILLYVGGVL